MTRGFATCVHPVHLHQEPSFGCVLASEMIRKSWETQRTTQAFEVTHCCNAIGRTDGAALATKRPFIGSDSRSVAVAKTENVRNKISRSIFFRAARSA